MTATLVDITKFDREYADLEAERANLQADQRTLRSKVAREIEEENRARVEGRSNGWFARADGSRIPSPEVGRLNEVQERLGDPARHAAWLNSRRRAGLAAYEAVRERWASVVAAHCLALADQHDAAVAHLRMTRALHEDGVLVPVDTRFPEPWMRDLESIVRFIRQAVDQDLLPLDVLPEAMRAAVAECDPTKRTEWIRGA